MHKANGGDVIIWYAGSPSSGQQTSWGIFYSPIKVTSTYNYIRWRNMPTSILLYEPYANKSSQICPFLAARAQFDSDHHQNRRLSSHSYSHESVIIIF